MTNGATPSADVLIDEAAGYAEYEIDVERVLRGDLPGIFERVAIAPLTEEAINSIPLGAKGAYVLYEEGRPVYAGKTDVRHGFRNRLNRHRNTIQHRVGFNHESIGFKAVRIMVFSNFDVEAILIDELRRLDAEALAWNYSGFGSNDPGRNREKQEPAPFDTARPVNIDRPLDFLEPGQSSAFDVLLKLKSGLPYVFRYQTDAGRGYTVGHADQRGVDVVVPTGQPTLREVLKLVLAAMPSGWRVTVFPGRVILYREEEKYAYAIETFGD